MKPYADTNYFTALLCGGPHAGAAEELQASSLEQGGPPLPATFLIRMEVANAIEQQVFLARAGALGVHASPEAAMIQEATFMDELQRGETMAPANLDLGLLEESFLTLAHRHTAREGFRTYDILHVAAALLLECDMFWSFDARAKKLAKLEGLTTN